MIREYIYRIGNLDLRSLALLRISTACLVLHDAAVRFFSAEAFTSAAGVLPLTALPKPEIFWRSPLHSFGDAAVYQYALLIVLIVAALSLAVGFKTRISGIVAWFILGSLHERNILILHSSDTLLRLALFWGIFLPWGRRFSYDARRTQAVSTDASLAGIAYLLQMASVYFFSALHKTGAEWRHDFTAVFAAVSTGEFSGDAGAWLAGFPAITKILTVLVITAEFAAPLLIVPGLVRSVILYGLLLMQAGFGIFLNLGPFPFISAAVLLGLIPSAVWNRWLPEPRVATTEQKGEGIVQRLALAYLILFTLAWNLVSLPASPLKPEPLFRETARALHLDQNWAMFAPAPPHESSWLTSEAVATNGEILDLWNGFRVGVNPTRSEMRSTWGDWRWFKYLQNLRGGSRPEDARRFAAYLCLRHENVRHLKLFVHTLRHGAKAGQAEKRVLVEIDCQI